jgi:hypothetical protein
VPNQHKNPMLGWRPPADLSAWARAEARRRGVHLKVILDAALARYREHTENEENGGGHATPGQ